MANQEYLTHGIWAWNQWRKEHADIQPDFSDANLGGAQLHGAILDGADLTAANFVQASLSGADLTGAFLNYANLSSCANLNNSRFIGAILYKANLSRANLSFANLSGADLTGTNLSGADVNYADLTGAILAGANLSEASVGGTIFGDIDLSVAKGLEAVAHQGKSYIDIHTIYRSGGNIPQAFLRGIGAPETMIEYMHSLVGKPIDYYSCFISYSSKDQDFAERLYADLQSNNVRSWFAPHDLKTGDRYRDRIDESIRLYDKLLLILSENAVASTWVEEEVEKATDKERQLRSQGHKRTVLFPIKLDDTVMQTTTAWAADVRRLWHIGDFIGWHDSACYQRAFTKLLGDLKSEA